MQSSTSTNQQSRYFDLGAMASLANMRFATSHQIEGSYTGRHRSARQGGAGEFADYREYVEGEDLRRLDWKVLGRTGRAYTRLYQDETNLRCTLAIDASGSMLFGDHAAGNGDGAAMAKLEYVQWLTTAISHLIGQQQDQVGLALLADGLRDLTAMGSTSSHIRLVHSCIEGLSTTPATRLAEGLRTLFDRSKRRGVLMLLSDFLCDDLEQVFASLRLFRHRRWEVITMHVVHPMEERLPDGVAWRFEGLENDGMVDCSPTDLAQAYQERFAAHAQMVRTLSMASGCDYRRLSTAVPYLQTLAQFLVARSG